MEEAFTLFNIDDNGKIAPSELGILFHSLGGNPMLAQLKSIIIEEKLTSPFDFNRSTDLMANEKIYREGDEESIFPRGFSTIDLSAVDRY
ncbi:hypothetical protein L2E82_45155 [Cichorium intybus]|uniref:Uncharacterized protein n=1 Tax=Cichorium intybus TaxID=13427 RepID=A0ACB8ZT73_CICIN|nr:hypothetical protein L2E82_45155 [Cichorium intybus]